jgi:two-component system, OmpR family, sensor histidine kinase KdpD
MDPGGFRWGRVSGRAVAVGVLAPAAAALLALPGIDLDPSIGVAIFLLAVTIAAVSGGLWAGLIAGVISSFLYPVMSEPDIGLRFDEPRDLIAAVVFLAVAVVVGLVVGSNADERDRATRREREARLLVQLSSTLLGDVPDRVLEDFVQLLLEPLGLAVCSVTVTLDGHEIAARAEDPRVRAGGPAELVPIVAGSIPLGHLVAERPAARRPFTRVEKQLLEASVRQLAVALDRARLEARARLAQLDAETNQLRAAMFSSVTHDLRTPLASIKAGVTSLLDEHVTYDTAQERELLTTILEETDRLNRLVGNILDLARIRAGALIPRVVPTAIDEVAEVAVARAQTLVGATRLELMLSPDLPEVPGDPVQLDQVFTNLIENAIRHSPPGGVVRIHVTSEREHVRIRITDQGAGIPASEREKVFEAFYRGKDNPESAGSGLGLAIVRAIVIAHEGKVWIEEMAGGGTAFVVELPLVGTEAP